MSTDAGDIVNSVFLTFDKGEDSYLQQYSRVVMVKVFFAASIVTWYRWDSNDMTCNILKNDNYSASIIPQTCWNNGVYVYKEIQNSELYGIPNNFEIDGRFKNGSLCKTNTSYRGGGVPEDMECKKMTKIFFKQYQYIHLVLLIISIIYWIPYWIFEFIESDIISLKHQLNSMQEILNSQDIKFNKKPLEYQQIQRNLSDKQIKKYFDKMVSIKDAMKIKKMEEAAKIIKDTFFSTPCENLEGKIKVKLDKLREPGKILFRLFYAAVNLIPLFLLNWIYNGYFVSLGIRWMRWDPVRQTYYEYLGNALLPVITFCDVHKLVKLEYDVIDQSKLICEVVKHAYTRYVFLILWIAISIGLILSPLDAVLDLLELVKTHRKYKRIRKIKIQDQQHDILDLEKKLKMKSINMTLRRIRYFLLIKECNEKLLGKVLDQIFQEEAMPVDSPSKGRRRRKRNNLNKQRRDIIVTSIDNEMERPALLTREKCLSATPRPITNVSGYLPCPINESRSRPVSALPSMFPYIEEEEEEEEEETIEEDKTRLVEEESIELKSITHDILDSLGGCTHQDKDETTLEEVVIEEDIERIPDYGVNDDELKNDSSQDIFGRQSSSNCFTSE